MRRWRYRPGRTQWVDLNLAGLRTIADLMAGRVTVEDISPTPKPVEPVLWN